MDVKQDALDGFEELKKGSKERNFTQTVDLVVNLDNIDLSEPENRFSTDVILPEGRGKERSVCIIADSKITKARNLDVNVLSKDDLDDLEGNRDKVKEIAGENDYFMAEAPLMEKIGKVLGPVLGPRGKMPKPFSPNDDLEELVGKSMKSLTIKVGEDTALHFPVGTEGMKPSEVAENVEAVINRIERNLPKGPQQIGSAYLKLTMSNPTQVI